MARGTRDEVLIVKLAECSVYRRLRARHLVRELPEGPRAVHIVKFEVDERRRRREVCEPFARSDIEVAEGGVAH